MLFSQSPSLRALSVVIFVYGNPVSFCICWKICLKGNKNHNFRCPRGWIRVPCGCGRRGNSQLADLVAGLGTAAPRGDIWAGRGCRHSEGSSSPLPFPEAQEPPGIPTGPALWDPGLGFSLAPVLAGVKQIWSCRNWDCTGAAASHLLRAAGLEDGAFNSMLILT